MNDSHSVAVPVTLKDLLAAARLQLRWILGDEQAKARTVSWAHSTELLDPTPYLIGGELVCTIGAMLTGQKSCRTFVKALTHSEASAICFGIGDLHSDIPQHLIEACTEFAIPLLEAPLGVRFMAINEYLSDRHVFAQTLDSQREQRLISNMLTGVRTRIPMQKLLAIASRATYGNLELLPLGKPHNTDVPESNSSILTSSVEINDASSLVWNGNGPPPKVSLLKQIAQVVEVASYERDIEESFSRERVGQLLILIGDGLAHPNALKSMLKERNPDPGYMVASAWQPGATALLADHLEHILVGETPKVAIALTDTVNAIREAATNLSLVCGYGSRVVVADIRRSIEEARAALKLARTSGGVVGPDGLTSLEGLLEQQPWERLIPFVDQIILPLIASDIHNGAMLIETLRAFLQLDGKLQATASYCYLHVNTIRHRLARIHKITGRDPLSFHDRTALEVALWAYDNRQRSNERYRS